MRILIVNIDSIIPNLALKKIEKYHLDRGDTIHYADPVRTQIIHYNVDKIYVSCVFSENFVKAKSWEPIASIGGSGYNLNVTLPEEIEVVKPHINLGFTTRGCIRKCQFCIVPQKEGAIRVVGDLLDLWDHKSKDITLLDNNITALFDHFALICKQARENKLRLDFNQGLDHRLLNQDIIDLLKSISHREYRFAFDHPSYLPTVEKAIDLLQENGLKRCMWYVLVGFNTTIQEDLMRLNYLRERKQNAYVQRHINCKNKKEYVIMARWANQHSIFYTHTLDEFIDKDPQYDSSMKLLFNKENEYERIS